MAVFAKFDGVDGESKDAEHEKWIDVLSTDWGMDKPGGGASGQSRRRGSSVIRDLTLVFEYEKAAPKLMAKQWGGEVIPKLEIHNTATYGGARLIYMKIEMEKVSLTNMQYSASGNDEAGPPTCVCSVNCEKGKVTYTEYDDDGNACGDVEFTFQAEKGTS